MFTVTQTSRWCVTITPAFCFLGCKIQRRSKRDKWAETSLVTVSLTDRVRARQVCLPVCHWAGRCTDGQDWTPCLSGSASPPPQSPSHTAKRSRPAAGSHPRGSETNTKGMTIIKKSTCKNNKKRWQTGKSLRKEQTETFIFNFQRKLSQNLRKDLLH